MIHIVGHTAIDHISKVPHLPEKNCSTHISDRRIYFGGGASNIAAGIATLGEQVTLHSCVGGDFAGERLRQMDDRARHPSAVLCRSGSPYADGVHVYGRSRRPDDVLRMGCIKGVRKLRSPVPPVRAHGNGDPEFNCRVAERSEFTSFDPGQDVFWYTKTARVDHRIYRHSVRQPP